MSLNLGTDGCNAARDLRGNANWETLRAAVRNLVTQCMNQALDATPERKGDATGYARALRDMCLAFDSATTGVNQNQVKKPGPVKE